MTYLCRIATALLFVVTLSFGTAALASEYCIVTNECGAQCEAYAPAGGSVQCTPMFYAVRCLSFDANGNLLDAGMATCGSSTIVGC